MRPKTGSYIVSLQEQIAPEKHRTIRVYFARYHKHYVLYVWLNVALMCNPCTMVQIKEGNNPENNITLFGAKQKNFKLLGGIYAMVGIERTQDAAIIYVSTLFICNKQILIKVHRQSQIAFEETSQLQR